MSKKTWAAVAATAAIALAVILSVAALVVAALGSDGRDGEGFNLYSVYQQLVDAGEFDGTYSEFVAQYLNPEYTYEAGSDLGRSINASLASVVSIEVECTYTVRGGGGMPGGGSSAVSFISSGSGVIYTLDREAGDAYIVTNCHVVYMNETITDGGATYTKSGEASYYAYLYGLEGLYHDSTGELYRSTDYRIKCSLVGYVMSEDLAVLKVEDSDVLKDSLAEAVTVGDSDGIAVGDEVYLIGNALGEGLSVTTGIVSVENEPILISNAAGTETLELRAIRTDSAASPGNSGGGMFDADGRLIGILFAGSSDEDAQNVNSVLPINRVAGIADSIIDAYEGAGSSSAVTSVDKATMGVTVQTSASKQVYDDENNKFYTQDTLTITGVSTGASAGLLQSGDVIRSVSLSNGEGTYYTVDIDHSWQISDLLWRIRLGDTMTVSVERNGEATTVAIPFDSENYFTATA